MDFFDDFQVGLYENKPTDVWFTPQNIGQSEDRDKVTPVNLNAITYYARLGMKPKKIAVLVGTTHTTIWDNNKMRQAYENGQAYHELWVRQGMMLAAKDNGSYDSLISRAAGKAEVDHQDGMDPESLKEAKASEVIKVKFELEDTSTDPEIQALKELLDQRVREAEGKGK